MAVSTAAIIPSGSTSAPQSPHTSAAVLEHLCLFTHDLKRKQKRWQDGRLKYHTFNKRIMVYDERGYQIGDAHWRNDYDFGEGEEVKLERGGVIVQVSECVGRQEQDLSELVDKRVQEKEQRSRNAASRTPMLRLRPEARLPQAVRPRVGHRPLHHVIGTPTGHHGRASVPKESPFEERQRQQNQEAGAEPESRPSKRTRYDDSLPSKSGYAQSLFGARLTLSSQPVSSLPPRNQVDHTAPAMDVDERSQDRPSGQDGDLEKTPRRPSSPHLPPDGVTERADEAGPGRPSASKSRYPVTTPSSVPPSNGTARQHMRPVGSLARDYRSDLTRSSQSCRDESAPEPEPVPQPQPPPAEKSQREWPTKSKSRMNPPQPPPQDVIILDAESSSPAIQPAPDSQVKDGQGQQKSRIGLKGRDEGPAKRKPKRTVVIIELPGTSNEEAGSGPTTSDDWENEAEEARKHERTTEIRLRSRGRRGLLMVSNKAASRQHRTEEGNPSCQENDSDSPKEVEPSAPSPPPQRRNARQKTSRTVATEDADVQNHVLQDLPQNIPRSKPKQKKHSRASILSDDDEARDDAAGRNEQGSHALDDDDDDDDDDGMEGPARKTRRTDQREKKRQNRRRDESDREIDEVVRMKPKVAVKPRLAKLARKSIKSMEIIGLQFDDEAESGLTFGPGYMRHEPREVIKSNEGNPQVPRPAAGSSSRPPPRIANPATRGRKAALKSHAAGQVPQSILPPAELFAQPRARAEDEQFLRPPSSELTAQPPQPPPLPPPPPAAAAAAAAAAGGVGAGAARQEPPTKRKMRFPGFGFLSATNNEGPWSREAHDLLGRRRPSA